MSKFGALLIAATVMTACGQPATVGSSQLPRVTRQGIHIDQETTTETLFLPGCPPFWETGKKMKPPPGACEQETPVTTVTATLGGRSVHTRVIGNPSIDPLYLLQPGSESDQGLTVVVAAVRPSVQQVRLVDTTGQVLDAVLADQTLVALAADAEDVTIEALDESGALVARCPPEGVEIAGVTYQCTPAPGVRPPITTTVTAPGP